MKPDSRGELFNFIGYISRKAYKNVFCLPNQGLSKSFENGGVFSKQRLRDEEEFPFFQLLVIILYSYLRNIFAFVSYLIKKIAFDLSGLHYHQSNYISGPIVFLDTYFINKKIIGTRLFQEYYFPGLTNILEKKDIPFAYTPKFFGTDNPIEFYKSCKILQKQRLPVLTEFQGVTWSEIAKILIFVIVYPMLISCTALSIKKKSLETKMVKRLLFLSLCAEGVGGYSRYLFGCRIARKIRNEAKCISWYENQSIDKCFYRGLRRARKNIRIYGAQLFIRPSGMINLIPDEMEKDLDVVPDVILANGAFYIPENTNLNYRLGPSLRYKKVFKKGPSPFYEGNFLILLPYFVSEIDHILKIVDCIEPGDGRKIVIKFHPTTDEASFRHYADKYQFTNKSIYELFEKTALAIGTETGSLVEAVTQGIPVVHIEQQNKINYNPLPEIGKGIVWQSAKSSDDAINAVAGLLDQIKNNADQLIGIAMDYRRLLFHDPNEKNIVKAFDL